MHDPEAPTQLPREEPQGERLKGGLPSAIGAYRVLEVVGEGGFGVVYLAEQREPVRRRVAVKVLKAGMDTAEVIGRFEAERQALAVMDHPHIAKVFDAGVTSEGRPYFAMEFVGGIPITAHCDASRCSTRERLELFVQVCRAVQHAHHRGIIHRDLKPSNVLVSVVDGKAVPKVIDFGIAKATTQRLSDTTVYTQAGRLMGTPEYMSPEQAGVFGGAGERDIDTRTDVYSLGVMLYELLAGVLPFDGRSLRRAGYAEVQRVIRDVDPPSPSARLSRLGGDEGEAEAIARARRTDATGLRREIRGELDWITMRALEKDRARRYESPSALAGDIERFLADEPVQAGPPGATYRAKKFVRRHSVGVAFAGTAAALLGAGVAGTFGFALRERAQRREVEKRERDLLQVTQFQTAMLGGIDPEQAGKRLLARLEHDSPGLAAGLGSVNGTDVALDFIDRTILAPAEGAIDAQFKEQPATDATLRQSLAETYARLGLLDRALPLLRRALETRRAALGSDHPDTITAAGNVGYILHALGKLDEADPYFVEAVERLERLRGREHPELAAHLSNLGLLRVDQGRATEAIPYYQRALAIQTRAKGSDDADTLLYENNLGGALEAIGDNAGAETHYRRSLEGTIRTTGADSLDALSGMNNLAGVLESQGKNEQAEEFYRRSLEGRKHLLGTTHPSTLLAVNNLGYLLNRTGRAGEAQSLLGEALTAARASLGEDHPRTMTLRHNFGEALRRGGEAARAEEEFRATHASRASALGPSHPDTITTHVSLALAVRDQGRLRDAAAELERAARAAEGHLDASVPVAGALRAALAETYEQLEAKEPGTGWAEKAKAARSAVVAKPVPSPTPK